VSWVFLDVAAVEALHHQQIKRFGGSYGLRDAGLLESAIMRAENKAAYEEEATAAEIAASLGWGLIKNHAFIDGNKRIGLVSMVVFLRLNGYALVASEAEQVAMVLKAAASEISEEEWTTWVGRNVRAGH
jgi:death-on-curing protein